MANSIFNFEVTKPTDVSAEEFAAFSEAAEGGGQFFSDPGSYELKVTKIEFNGPAKDPTWQKVALELESISGQTIKNWVLVPTTKIGYTTATGKETEFLFKKYKDLLIALGVNEVNHDNVLGFANGLFTEQKIIGMGLQTILGYEGAYAKYHGQSVEGTANYVLVVRGEVTTDAESGEPLIFGSRQAVEAHCTQLGIQDYSPFIQILNFGACPDPSQLSVIGSKPASVANKSW